MNKLFSVKKVVLILRVDKKDGKTPVQKTSLLDIASDQSWENAVKIRKQNKGSYIV